MCSQFLYFWVFFIAGTFSNEMQFWRDISFCVYFTLSFIPSVFCWPSPLVRNCVAPSWVSPSIAWCHENKASSPIFFTLRDQETSPSSSSSLLSLLTLPSKNCRSLFLFPLRCFILPTTSPPSTMPGVPSEPGLREISSRCNEIAASIWNAESKWNCGISDVGNATKLRTAIRSRLSCLNLGRLMNKIT